MIRVIHTGDLHLGGKYPEKANSSIDFMLNEINTFGSPAFEPDLFLCTGDSTEKALHVHSDHLKPLLNLIHNIDCPKVFLQGTPSHEPYGFLHNLKSASGDKIIVMEKPEVITVSGNRISLAALPALTRISLQNWGRDILGLDDCDPEAYIQAFMKFFASEWKSTLRKINCENIPKILLGHWTITGCATATGQTMYGSDLSVGLEDIALSGADATCVGHIHFDQEWHHPNYIGFCGSTYPNNWGERDPKSFKVLTFDKSTGKLLKVERVKFPHKPMVKINWEFTGQQKDGEWELLSSCPDLANENDILEIDDSYEIKVVYSVPKEIAPQIDDMYVRLRFRQEIGFDLTALDRVLRASDRNLASEIGISEATRDQYTKACEIKGETPRIHALDKADTLDDLHERGMLS